MWDMFFYPGGHKAIESTWIFWDLEEYTRTKPSWRESPAQARAARAKHIWPDTPAPAKGLLLRPGRCCLLDLHYPLMGLAKLYFAIYKGFMSFQDFQYNPGEASGARDHCLHIRSPEFLHGLNNSRLCLSPSDYHNSLAGACRFHPSARDQWASVELERAGHARKGWRSYACWHHDPPPRSHDRNSTLLWVFELEFPANRSRHPLRVLVERSIGIDGLNVRLRMGAVPSTRLCSRWILNGLILRNGAWPAAKAVPENVTVHIPFPSWSAVAARRCRIAGRKPNTA